MEEPELFDAPAAKAADEAILLREARSEPASIAAVQPDLIDEEVVRTAPQRGYADDDEPLFPEVHGDRRQHKGGWLSLFGGGRPRYDAPAPQAALPREAPQRPAAGPTAQIRTTASAQLAEEPRGDEGEDLNIPSFLRRLAN
jgi:cell division protein FtsZ